MGSNSDIITVIHGLMSWNMKLPKFRGVASEDELLYFVLFEGPHSNMKKRAQ